MSGKITITNQSPAISIIDIEGVIGVSEKSQFKEPGERVATYQTFREVVGALKQIDAAEIVVNIRSSGGSVNDALLIFDALSELEGRVTTKCFGYVASAATIIAQAASQGCREMSANALYLVHNSVCATEGNVEEIKRSLETLSKTDERIAEIYAERSGKSVDSFVALMGENGGSGRWLSAKEAKEYGLIDRIKGRSKVAKDAGDVVSNLGLPPIPQDISARSERSKIGAVIAKQWSAILETLGINEPEQPEVEVELRAEAKAEAELRAEVETKSKPEPEIKPLEASRGIRASKAPEDSKAPKIVDTSKSVDEPHNSEVLALKGTIEQMEHAQVELLEIKSQEIKDLQNKISLLESHNARLLALPTATEPKEDPAVHEAKLSPNEEAYYGDLQGFR